jgi:1-acyl-sn-glycerol-3-phosphate acyltransferase
MKLLYRWLKGGLIIVLFAIGGVLASTLQPLCRNAPVRWLNRLVPKIQAIWLRAVCSVLGVRLSIQGTPMTGNGLWVSNHISWLDVVLLGAFQPVAFLAKSEVASWPLVGFLARQSGNLFVQRGNSGGEIVETMTQRLQAGDRLVLFPEGTTTRGDTVRNFHGRMLQPAISAGVPVQTVAIAYQGEAFEAVPFVGDDDFLSNLLALLHLPTIHVTLHFGEPLLTDGIQRNALARRARSQVLSALALEDDFTQAA